jgi:hypothetical protein
MAGQCWRSTIRGLRNKTAWVAFKDVTSCIMAETCVSGKPTAVLSHPEDDGFKFLRNYMVSLLTQNTWIIMKPNISELKCNFEILYCCFLLILFHGSSSTAWIRLETVLDCGILHYTCTLIAEKLHFFTLPFNHLFLRNFRISVLYYVTRY